MPSLSPIERVETGRAIGHDLYRLGRIGKPHAWPAPVLEGFAEARSTGLARQPPDRFVRKWLQLRLSAYQRGRVLNDDVTPALLRDIDVHTCPVTRVTLTHGELIDTDWSVDRLNNDGAYAVNNLAVMSTKANGAKGGLGFEAVLDRSRHAVAIDGLEPVEWLRLAALMLGPCFASRPADAPTIPLVAPIPNRSIRLATQQIQHVLTCSASSQAGKNALFKQFKAATFTPNGLLRLRVLCDALQQGLKGLDHPHDVWLAPGVMDAFLAWRACLDLRALALAGEVSRRLAQGRRVPVTRLQTWHLAHRGYQY